VAAGVGVGFIARSNIEEDIRARALVAITLADAQIRRDLPSCSAKTSRIAAPPAPSWKSPSSKKTFPPQGWSGKAIQMTRLAPLYSAVDPASGRTGQKQPSTARRRRPRYKLIA